MQWEGKKGLSWRKIEQCLYCEDEGRLYIISGCSTLGSSLVFTSWLELAFIMITQLLLMEKSGWRASSGNSFVSKC